MAALVSATAGVRGTPSFAEAAVLVTGAVPRALLGVGAAQSCGLPDLVLGARGEARRQLQGTKVLKAHWGRAADPPGDFLG